MTSSEFNLPSPPFINVPGLPNFRDLGGYPVASRPGHMTRRGLVYRCAEPSQITDAGISLLRDTLGIYRVYDLRSERELARDQEREQGKEGESRIEDSKAEEKKKSNGRPIRTWPGTERIFAPVFRDHDYSPEAIALRFGHYASGAEGFVKAYDMILHAAADPGNEAQPYARILGELSSPTTQEGEGRASGGPKPIMMHCTAGKDRAGVISALVLALCGVDDDVVAHEYSLTDLGLVSEHQRIVDHLLQEPRFRDDPEGPWRMVKARKENMKGTLEMIRARYGSVEQCVVKLGLLTEDGVQRLRGNMVVPVGSSAKGSGPVVDWEKNAKLVL